MRSKTFGVLLRSLKGRSVSLACRVCLVVVGLSTISACGGGGSSGGASGASGAYSISGTVSGAASTGVNVSLTGAMTVSTTSDVNGNYRFTGLVKGTYSITPSLTGVIFKPSSLTVTINGSSASNQNFAELVTQVAASGIQFLPAGLLSSNQYRVPLVPEAGGLFFTDSSNTQLKRLDAATGAVTSMASRIGTPESVAIRGQNVFWVDGDRLNKTMLDGTATAILQTGARDRIAGVTADLVVDDTDVYWANTVTSSGCSPSCNWTIQRVPVVGGAPATLVSASRKIAALTSDASNIYWEEASLEPVTPGCNCGSSIKMIPKSGGAVVLLVDNRLNSTLPAPPPGTAAGSWLPTGGIAVSGSQLLFGVAGAPSYQIMSVAIPAGTLTTLASVSSTAGVSAGSIASLKVDGTNVYWIDGGDGAIDTVPIGGGSVTPLATGLGSPAALQVASGMVFWTEAGATPQIGAGSVRRVLVAGGAPSTVVGNLDAPASLAIDASSNIVWAEFWRLAKSTSGGVAVTLASGISSDLPRIAADQSNLYVLDGVLLKSMPLGGGTLEKLASAHGGAIVDLAGINQDIATDGVNVYWSVTSSADQVTVRKVPVSGGAVVTLAADSGFGYPQNCYWRIAVDAQNVYWSDPSSSFPIGCAIKKVPIAGGAVTTLVDFAYLADFTVDGTNVYFSELGSNPGSIRQVPVNGGPVAVLTGNVTAEVLAVDATNLYWVDPSRSGGIWSIAKSGGPAGAATLLALGPLATDPLLAYEGLVVNQNTLVWSETLANAIFLEALP
jgi:hypothetical protein